MKPIKWATERVSKTGRLEVPSELHILEGRGFSEIHIII